MRLILWDIDHTLIDTRGIGQELSGEAFERTTGQPMLRQARIDGITEAVIFRETAKLHGLTPTRSDFERFARELTDRHLARLADLRSTGHALPGAAAALEALAARDGFAQTAVTGNVRPVAEIKLRAFGLDHHIDWPAGGYGEDADDRPTWYASPCGGPPPTTESTSAGGTPSSWETPLPTSPPLSRPASRSSRWHRASSPRKNYGMPARNARCRTWPTRRRSSGASTICWGIEGNPPRQDSWLRSCRPLAMRARNTVFGSGDPMSPTVGGGLRSKAKTVKLTCSQGR